MGNRTETAMQRMQTRTRGANIMTWILVTIAFVGGTYLGVTLKTILIMSKGGSDK